VAAAVAPVLDHAAAGLWQVARATTVVTAPVRRATHAYASGLGFVRHWKMFVPPTRNDEYVRLRYYVASAHSSGGTPTWAASEMVLPAHPFSEVRGIAAFRDRRRDKAVDTMADRYRQRMRTRQRAGQANFSDDLQPAARYYSRQFAKGHLQAGERIVRVEVWLGRSPSPLPGRSDNPQLKAKREQVLDGYYRGPVESQLGNVRYSPYGAAEQEADITWTLMFFEAI
jgi:hypothetical protein